MSLRFDAPHLAFREDLYFRNCCTMLYNTIAYKKENKSLLNPRQQFYILLEVCAGLHSSAPR